MYYLHSLFEFSADNLGILRYDSLCLSGSDLDQLRGSPQQLASSVCRASVFYRMNPKHKVIIVKVSYGRRKTNIFKECCLLTKISLFCFERCIDIFLGLKLQNILQL